MLWQSNCFSSRTIRPTESAALTRGDFSTTEHINQARVLLQEGKKRPTGEWQGQGRGSEGDGSRCSVCIRGRGGACTYRRYSLGTDW